MTHFTSAQINELAGIILGTPVSRAPSKGKALARFTKIAEADGHDADAILAMTFPYAFAKLSGGQSESVLEARAAEAVGTGGPGLKRLRNHPDYAKIVEETQKEAEAALNGKDPFAKPKKAEETPAPDAGAKAPKAKATKFGPDDLISVIQDNPKRPGTKAHAIFALYGSGTKVSAFTDAVKNAGYTEAEARANLSWDTRKGFIHVA